ncbi:SlyX family protein [Rhodocyclaceae bacterium SMB388]
MEERLECIETKIAFTEDLVEDLNLTVFRQQEQIDRLREQVARLTDLIGDLDASRQRDPRDEIPPHY